VDGRERCSSRPKPAQFGQNRPHVGRNWRLYLDGSIIIGMLEFQSPGVKRLAVE
jgi:hypothetical protein